MITLAAHSRRIVWAVDPFAKAPQLQRATAWAIKTFLQDQVAEILPVYVDSPLLSRSLMTIDELKRVGQTRLDRIVRGVGLTGLAPLTIHFEPKTALQDQVASLVDRAREARADLIALSTRAKSGPSRWLLGSFAESLSLVSEIPLLVVNPSWTRRTNFREILFATDFSPDSHAAFGKVIELARAQDAKIRLFHKIKYENNPAVEVAFRGYPRYRAVFEKEVQARQAEARRWAEEAGAAGARVETEIDSGLSGSIADAIIKRARKKPCLIALASHNSPAWRVLIGSTSRRVLRESGEPVWVIHPQTPGKAKSDPLYRVSEQELLEDLA